MAALQADKRCPEGAETFQPRATPWEANFSSFVLLVPFVVPSSNASNGDGSLTAARFRKKASAGMPGRHIPQQVAPHAVRIAEDVAPQGQISQ